MNVREIVECIFTVNKNMYLMKVFYLITPKKIYSIHINIICSAPMCTVFKSNHWLMKDIVVKLHFKFSIKYLDRYSKLILRLLKQPHALCYIGTCNVSNTIIAIFIAAKHSFINAIIIVFYIYKVTYTSGHIMPFI